MDQNRIKKNKLHYNATATQKLMSFTLGKKATAAGCILEHFIIAAE